ncbi:MAG: hypothetical protein ACLS4S_12805 [Bacteroides nordii]
MKKITHLIICSLLLVMAACEKDTEPANFAPKLATGEATNIYRTGATLSGSMEKAEGVVVKEYGILYSTLQSMAEYTEMKVDEKSGNDFAVQLQGLESDKTYYYCAYAHSGYSIAKGEIRSFTTGASNTPVFSALEVSGTDEKSFTVSTSILDEGGGEILFSGFCWKETSVSGYLPTEKDEMKVIDNLSNYRLRIKDLKPGRQYAVRAYSVSTKGIGYGETAYIITKMTDLPVVSSSVPQDSTETSITLLARILANGTTVTEKGFCYSTEMEEPTITGLKEIAYTPDTTIYATISSLKPGNTYYIRAYAVGQQGVGYGDVITYTIPDDGHQAVPPVVTTLSAEDLGNSTAVLTGSIATDNLEGITSFGFTWQSKSSSIENVVIENYPSGNISQLTGIFTLKLEGLPTEETIQAYAWAIREVNGQELRGQGDWIEFTLAQTVQPATVTQTTVRDITVHTVSAIAEVTSNGGSEITESGFYYSTTHALPDERDLHVSSLTTGNNITANLVGLEEGQTYYIRAYAINQAGLSYGAVGDFQTKSVTLPIVKTGAVTNVTSASANLSGTITSLGNGSLQRKGFCWSSTHTVPSLEQREGSSEVSTEGSAYFYELTGLSGKTRYYVRAYAENEKGVSYGETQEFTTGTSAVVPTLSGTTISEIGETSAKATATVVSDGGASVSGKGFCYSLTNSSPTIEGGSTTLADVSTGNSITGVLKNLEPDAKYYIRAYATNGEGTAYGVVYTFSTQKVSSIPTVGATVINTVTKTTAEVSSSISNDGGATITENGFCYSITNTVPTISDNKINSDISKKDFTGSLAALAMGTQYYIRAYAVNTNGISYGETNSFTTRSDIPDNSDNQSPDKK